MSQDVRQSLSQGMSFTLEVSQQLCEALSAITSGGPGDPKIRISSIIEQILASITSVQLRTAVTEFVRSCNDLDKALVDSRELLAVASPDRVKQFIVEHIFRSNTENGRFIHAKQDGIATTDDLPKTRVDHFLKAYFEPKKFKVATEVYHQMLQGSRGNVYSVDEYSEMVVATNMVTEIRSLLDTACLVMQYIFQVKSTDGSPILQSYLRDLVILENLRFLLSERLLKRYVNRFKKLPASARHQDYEEMILNTIAEFTLLSMGIISPNIFELKRVPRDTEQYQGVVESLKKIGVDLDSLMKRYRLSTTVDIIWFSRYSTAKVRSCATSETVVRTFITDTVRADRVALLEAVEYEHLFGRIKESKQDNTDDETFAEDIVAMLNESLSAQKFQDTLIALLRKWYPKFECLL